MSASRALALCFSLLALVACKEDGPGELLGNGSGSMQDSGSPDGAQADGGNVDASNGGGGSGDGGSQGTGGGNDGGADGGGGSGGSDDGGTTGPFRDPSTITGIRQPAVPCGSSECVGTTQVCCDRWTSGGWQAPTCVEKAECNTAAGPLAAENNVKSECDGPLDCPSGTADDPVVCCFILQSAPHYDLATLTRLPGPGYGRECLRKSACLADDIAEAEASEGMPRGIVSCSQDADCDVAGDGLSCEPEAASDESAGDIAPRSHVSLCK